MLQKAPKDRYCAFISYSQKDTKSAIWLQRQLEHYVFPKELEGQRTPRCTIGRKLGRFFRDKDQLVAGTDLSEAIAEALEASDSLIVLCSSASARSDFVRAEITNFKQLRRGDPIIPVVVDPSPDFAIESFPELADSRRSTALGIEGVPVAADMRQDRDGKELAKLKIISGLVGLPLEKLRQREAVAERRRRRMWTAIAVTSASLALAAGISAKIAVDNLSLAQKRLEDAAAITADFSSRVVADSDQLGIPADRALGLLKAVETAIENLSKEEAQAVTLKESKAEVTLALCDIHMKLGNLLEWERSAKSAEAQFRALLSQRPDKRARLEERLGKSTYQIGLALQEQGYLAASQVHFLQTRDIRQKIVDALSPDAPNYLDRKRDLSAVYLMLGQGARDLGAFSESLKYFQDTLLLREELRRREPDSASRRQDVSMALLEIGRTHLFLSNASEAEVALQRASEIRSKLSADDPHSTFFKRHHAWALAETSKLKLQQGNYPDALLDISQAIRLMEQVTASDSKNVIMRADLAWFLGFRGQVEKAQGSAAAALWQFERAAQVLQDLARQKGTHMGRMRDAAYWLYHRAATLSEAGRFEEALKLFDQAIDLLTPITASDESNATWRAELASNLIGKAAALEALGRDVERADVLQRAQRVLPRVNTTLPDDFPWKAPKPEVNGSLAPKDPIIIAGPANRPGPLGTGTTRSND